MKQMSSIPVSVADFVALTGSPHNAMKSYQAVVHRANSYESSYRNCQKNLNGGTRWFDGKRKSVVSNSSDGAGDESWLSLIGLYLLEF